MPLCRQLAILMTATALTIVPVAEIAGLGPTAVEAKGKGHGKAKGHKRAKRNGQNTIRAIERDLQSAIRTITGLAAIGQTTRPARHTATNPGTITRNSQIVTASLRPRMRDTAQGDDNARITPIAAYQPTENRQTRIDPESLSPETRDALKQLVSERPELATSLNTDIAPDETAATDTQDGTLSTMIEDRRVDRPANGGPLVIR